MPESFDAYHKWLAIPPDEQPPNHYRLLGLRVFESDHDVIETAVDQRMMLLRTFQSGRHSALSQKLLNEIAAAKIALLDSQKKAAIDAELKKKLAPENPAAKPLPKATPFATAPAAQGTTALRSVWTRIIRATKAIGEVEREIVEREIAEHEP